MLSDDTFSRFSFITRRPSGLTGGAEELYDVVCLVSATCVGENGLLEGADLGIPRRRYYFFDALVGAQGVIVGDGRSQQPIRTDPGSRVLVCYRVRYLAS